MGSAVVGTDCGWTATYTYSIEDECGNLAPDAVVVYTGADTQAPILTGVLPGGAQGNVCMAAAPAAPGEAAIAALYSDNCGSVTATLMGSAVVGTDCGWTATYTYSIEDECGNLAPDAVVVYTGADTQAPILTGVLPGGAQGNVCMAAAPAAPGEAAIAALYSDNCGSVTATLMGSAVVGTDCGWTATYTYSIEDECGNLAPDAVVVYTGADTQAPILTGVLPGGAQGNVCMAAAPAAPGEAAIAALYSDNCGSVTATLMGSAVVGTDCGWTATYTYSIEDECGNLAPDAVVVYTGADTQAPILTGVLPGGAQGNVCMAAAPAAPGEAAIAALYSDNCGSVTATLMGSAVVGTDCGWTATYTYSIEDECGNLAPDAVVVYTGADTQAPILTGVLPGGAQGNVCMAAAPAAPGEAAIAALYSDNCGSVTATLMGSAVVGTDCGWTATYTYSIEDECGNLAPDAVVVYTGADTQAPILTGVLPGGAQGNVCMAAAPAAPGEAAIAALYSDNCGSVTATLMGSAVVGTDCGWTATYTYSIEDECGNLAPDAVVVYTGADTQAPILTGVLPGGAQGNVCMAAAPAAPGEAAIAALYSDNCGSVTATLMGSAVVGTDCGWTATYTYSIEDECGNLAPDAVVVYTGADTQAPILTGVLPGGAQGNVCMAAAPAAPGEAAIAALYSDNCGSVTATLMGSAVVGTDCGWTATYTYSIEDECGNLAPDAVVVYTGADTQAPILTGVLPGGAQGNVCMAAAPAAPGEAAIAALYSDNCGSVTATLMGSAVVGTDCGWTATYTYSIEDECGNLAPDAVVVYTGADTQAPILTGVLPGGAQGNVCMAAAPAAPGEAAIAALYSDNCGIITATLMGSAVVGTDCGWTATYTYSIEDECGNLAPDAVVVYTGADTQAPTFTVPSNDTICRNLDCSYNSDATITGDVTDEDDNCSIGLEAVYVDDLSNALDCDQVGFITRTWTLTDNCGNFIIKNQIIWVEPVVTLQASGDTICSGGITDILVKSSNSATIGIRYTWSYTDNPNVTGETTSIGNGNLIGSNLAQELTNNSAMAQRVTYSITPWTIDENNANACAGMPLVIDVWVEPVVNISASDDSICNGGTVDIKVTSNSISTNGIRYTWTVTDNPQISGESGSVGAGLNIGSTLSQILTNTSMTPQMVTYTITPWTVDENGANACEGVALSLAIDVWVEPELSLAATDDTICNGGMTDIKISTPNTTTNGLQFTWTVTDNPNVTGESNSVGSGQPINTSIAQTLTNNSPDAQIITYTVTPWSVDEHFDNMCAGLPVDVDVWVEPTITLAATGDTICNGGTTDIPVTSLNTTTRGIRYTWTYTDNPDVTGETASAATGQNIGSVLSQTLTNNSISAQRVNYIITPWTIDEYNGNACAGTPISVDVWIEPSPVITAPGDTLCNGDATSILVSSANTSTSGIRYTWTVTDNPDVTGETASAGNGQNAGTPIVQPLTNTSDNAQKVTFTITPWTVNEFNNNSCPGSSINVDIWIEPTLIIAGNNDTICNGGITDLPVTSMNTTTKGMRYTWTVTDNPDVTGEAGSAGKGQNMGTLIQQTLINSSPDAQLVTYTITPWTISASDNNACAGTPISLDVWVEPTITLAATGDTICNGGTTDIPVTSLNTTTRGIRYTWTYTDNPDVTGETASAATGQNIGSVLSQTLTNNSISAQRVNYIITPWTIDEYNGNACAGTPISVDVWIEPSPVITAPGDTLCNGDATSILVSSANTSTSGIRYTWTVTDNPDVTGETASAGNGQNAGTPIVQPLTNTSDNAQKVTFTITPWTVNEFNNNSCPGSSINVDIWIEPTLIIAGNNDTICNGGITDLPVTSMNTTTKGMRYTWTVTDNPDVTGEAGSAGKGQNMGTLIQQTLINSSPDAQLVTYTITPWTISASDNNACAGTPISLDVWIEPTITLAATGDTICNGGTTDIPVTSLNTTTRGIRYTWTYTDNPDVTGETASAATGQNIGSVLSQTLTNNSISAQRVNYIITPWTIDEYNGNACAGTPISVDVWIEPSPVITAPGDTLCNGDATSILVSSANTSTSGIRYTWTVTDNPDVTGETASAGNGQNAGTPIVQPLTNTSDNAQKVTFTITPWTVNEFNNNSCPGSSINVDIWIEPTLIIAGNNDTICNGGITDLPVTSMNTTTKGMRYTWTVTDNPDVTGEAGSAGKGQNMGTLIQQTLINSSPDAQLVTYTITPWTISASDNNACAGTPISLDVWIEPTITLVATGDTICDGGTTIIPVTSTNTTTAGIRYTWTVTGNGNITGASASAGNGNDISVPLAQALDNTSSDKQMVTFTLTPFTVDENGNNACPGTPISVDVWVEPTVLIAATGDTICDGGTTDIPVTSTNTTTAGIRYTWTVTSNGNITGASASAGNGNDISVPLAQALDNTSSDKQMVTYTLTPFTVDENGNNACAGTPISVDVWVEPTVIVTASGDTLCNGGTTNVQVTSTNTTTNGIRYIWAVTDNPHISGESNSIGNGQNIGTSVIQTLINNSDSAQKVTYTLTPYTLDEQGNNACPGTPISIDIWIEPTATLLATGDTICNGGTTDIPVTSINTTTKGMRYTWTFIDNPNVTGESASTGFGQDMGTVLAQTLTNSMPDAQKVTYTLTPWTINQNSANTCAGAPVNIDVWVEPTVIVTASGDTLCNGGTTNVQVTSTNTTTNGIRYIWAVTDNPHISGESNSIGNGQNIGTSVIQTLINNSDSAQKVTYTLTPYTLDEQGNNACPGTPISIDIWIEPTATLFATGDTICNGGTTDIPVTSINTTTNGMRYTWTFIDNPNVTGESASTGFGQDMGTVLAQTLTNSMPDAQKVTYTLTPWTINQNSANTCAGAPVNIDVWVEPTAIVTATGDTLCNGGTTNVQVTSTNTTTNGIRYIWAVTDNPHISGESNSIGNGQNIGTSVIQTLINNSDSAQKVTYTLTPYTLDEQGNNACPGTPISIDVWIEPTARVIATLQKDTICSGDFTSIDLHSPSIPTRPVKIRYYTQVPFGLSVNPANGSAMNNDTILTETFVNTTDTAKQVVFIITPYIRESSSESEKCTGQPDTVRVWVEPTPKVRLTPSQDTICTSLRTSVNLSTVTRSKQPVRFYYEAQYDPLVVSVFYAQDTFNLSPGFTLVDSIVNLTTFPQKVTFVTYPYLNGPGNIRKCGGIPESAEIWIAPALHATIDSISAFIGGKNIKCKGDNSGFIRLMPDGGITAFSNYDVDDISYAWSNSKTTKNITQLIAGTYSVTIKDHFNCEDKKTIILTEPDSAITTSVLIFQNVSCYGSDGILVAEAKGGTRGYDYVWIQVPEDFGEEPDIHRRILSTAPEGRYYMEAYDTNRCKTETVWKDLTQPSAKFVGTYPVEYGKFQIKCNGESSGGWTSVNNSMTNIIYHWTGPNGLDTTFTNASLYNSFENQPAGRYTLHYSDISECKDVVYIDLDEPDPLIIENYTLSSFNDLYNTSCYGVNNGSITLNSIRGGHVSAGYTYSWTSLTGGNIEDTTLKNQAGLMAGQYSVVVSDTFNCAVKDTFNLIQPSEIRALPEVSQSITGGYSLNCFGDNGGSIILHPEGGDTRTSPYQFHWTQGSSAGELHNLVAGDYIVNIKDGINCSITDTISITEPPVLQIDSSHVTGHNGFAVSCFDGNDGDIRIYGKGGEGSYRYEWTVNNAPLGQDTSYIDNLVTGQYKINLYDANNCVTSRDFLLESPPQLTLLFENTNVNCTGLVKGSTRAMITGGLPDYGYSWETGESTQSRINLDTGRYALTVTDKNLCQVIDTSVIIQNPPVQITIQVTDSISCSGGTDGVLRAQVNTGIAPYQFDWNTGMHTETISNVNEGNYSVSVTDADQCSGTQSFIFSDPPKILAVVDVTGPSCFKSTDGSVTLGAFGGTPEYSYSWNDTLVDGIFVDQQIAGNYMLRIRDRRNCMIDTSIIIKEPEQLELTIDEINTEAPFCPDWQNGALAIRVSGGTPVYQFNWTGYPEETDSILNDIREDDYELSVTDLHGCTAEGIFTLSARNNTCLGIPTAFTPNYDFANDTWEINYINMDGGEANFHDIYPDGTIEIYDRLGNLVHHCTGGCAEPWNGEDLKGRPLPVDSYYFVIDLNNGKDQPPIKGVVTIIK